MSTPCAKISLLMLTSLLFAGLVCTSAFAEKIAGVTADASNHQGNFVADNLVDGDPATAWVGGGVSTGPGKWIELTFPAPVKGEYLMVANGHQGKGQFDTFRRLHRGVILYPDGTRQSFAIKPGPGMQKIPLQPRTGQSLRFIILGVTPGLGDAKVGKAKVAISEITVFGEMTESGELGEAAGVDEESGAEPVVVEEIVVVAKKEEAARQAEPVTTESKPVPAEVERTPAPEPAKVAPKPEVAPERKAAPVPKKAESKPVPAPNPKVETAPKVTPAPKEVAVKPAPKKVVPKKAAAKKKIVKAKPKKNAPQVGSAAGAGATILRAAVPIPVDKPLEIGVISPWLDLELVAQIKRYFGLLTTLHDSYPDVFVESIRERERAAFIVLQDEMRKGKEFGRHHIAMLEHIGLNFDKPTEGENSATVRVHGPYRYYIENQAFEFPVDTLFSFVKENGKWMISGVQDK